MLGSHTFVPISLMCKTQTRSHTDRRNLKLLLLMQVCAWMEFPLSISGTWLLKCYTVPPTKYRETKSEGGETCSIPNHQADTNTQTKTRIQNENLELSSVDFVSSHVKSSRSGAVLYIFEDNEAVIKMIIKGRSPRNMFVEPTELRWIGYLTGSTWTPRSKSNMLTRKTNSQTY